MPQAKKRKVVKEETLYSKKGSTKKSETTLSSNTYKNLLYGFLSVVVLFAMLVLLLRFIQPKTSTTMNTTGMITDEAAMTSVTSEASPTVVPTQIAQVTSQEAPTRVPTKIVQATPEKKPESSAKKGEYIVQAGDTLWSISEKMLKTGHNWKQIAQANNITNPGAIEKGTKLVIPTEAPQMAIQVSPTKAQEAPKTAQEKTETTGEGMTSVPSTITTGTYTIKAGDTLWDIAVRSYGDGYKWGEISRANNLSNPDIIHPGNTLKLPR